MFNHTNYYIQLQGADGELFARFTAFIVRVAISAKIDYIRRQRHWQWETLVDKLPERLDGCSTPEHWLITSTGGFHFAEDRISEALSVLSAKQQRILELLYIDELSAQEVAMILKCSVSHVYNQTFAAMKRLRANLAEGGDENA